MIPRAMTRAVRLPLHDEGVSPVKILDAEGRLVPVVPAEEFRASQASVQLPSRRWPERSRG
jgi:hypothetical protein